MAYGSMQAKHVSSGPGDKKGSIDFVFAASLAATDRIHDGCSFFLVTFVG